MGKSKKEKRAKCGVCKALQVTPKTFKCSLGVEVNYEKVEGLAVAPRPSQACYKPRTFKELRELLAKNI